MHPQLDMVRFIVKNTHELNVLPDYWGRFYRPNALACSSQRIASIGQQSDSQNNAASWRPPSRHQDFFLGGRDPSERPLPAGFGPFPFPKGRRFHFGRLTLNSA